MDDVSSSEARDRVGSSAPNPSPSTDGPAERLVRGGRPGTSRAPLWILPLAYLALAAGRLERALEELRTEYRANRMRDQLTLDLAVHGRAYVRARRGEEFGKIHYLERVDPADVEPRAIAPLPFWKGCLLMAWIGAWLGLVYCQARGLLW